MIFEAAQGIKKFLKNELIKHVCVRFESEWIEIIIHFELLHIDVVLESNAYTHCTSLVYNQLKSQHLHSWLHIMSWKCKLPSRNHKANKSLITLGKILTQSGKYTLDGLGCDVNVHIYHLNLFLNSNVITHKVYCTNLSNVGTIM